MDGVLTKIYSCKRTLKPETIHGRSTFCIESGDTFFIPISLLKVRCLKDSQLMDHYCEFHRPPFYIPTNSIYQLSLLRRLQRRHLSLARPTSALTFYVAGLTVISPQGKNWALAPHVGGPMNNTQGGFSTGLGWFGVSLELVWS